MTIYLDAVRIGLLGLAIAAGSAGAVRAQETEADSGTSRGREGPPGATSVDDPARVYDGSEGELEVRLSRLEDPDVRIDGVLDEAAWGRAVLLTGFTQYEPVEGIPASQETEVLVFYSPEAIYFGIRALDTEPERIQATIGERDASVRNDDWVRISLDTYHDQRRAYVFYVNPYGIQTDGLWLEGLERGRGGGRLPIDFNPDFIWESDGRLGEDGWYAEIRIPYISLQFEPRPSQSWGLQVAREIKRTGFKQSWTPVTADVTNQLALTGTLRDLQGLTPRKLMELNPVTTSKIEGQRIDDGEGPFRMGDVEPQFGLNARYGITRNLVLGATFNPDFSQVEADADQITVNERFAIFFSEKRPFFLEGTEVFESPNRLVHTRQIVDPIGGAKVTGKVGDFNVAWLGALDESPLHLETNEHRALFNLARVQKDIGTGSKVGFLYTDRAFPGGSEFNRVAAGDARLLLDNRHTLTVQAGGSWTRGGTEDGAREETRFGPLFSASLARSGRNLSWSVDLEDVGTDFRTESGFIRRIGDMRTAANVSRSFYGDAGSLVERWGLEARVDAYYDHADFWSGTERSPFEWEGELQGELSFRGDRFISFILRHGYFRFREEEYEDYSLRGPGGEPTPFAVPDPLDHMLAGGFFTFSRITESVRVGGRYFYREIPIFSEAAKGRELLISPSLDLQPTSSWSTELSYAFSRIWRSRDGSLFSTADIPRLETQYQFNRDLFFRAIVQYDLESRDALRDPRTEAPILIGGESSEEVDRGRFQTQLLLSYEPSPGTIFFVGWSRQMEGNRTFGLADMERTTEGFFAKLSYLWRF